MSEMWITALLLGLTASLHCAGMCSPLVMAVSRLSPSLITNRFFYNGGRILTYSILGAGFSSAGSLLPLATYQNILSIVFGIALLMLAVFKVSTIRIPYITPGLQWFSLFLKQKFSFFLKRANPGSVIVLGMLNGFLPCGMTLIAFGYCMILRGPMDGFNFMLLFGIGTLPVMLGFATVILLAAKKFHFNFQKVTTGLLLVSGFLLIARVFLHAGVEASRGNAEMIDIVLCR